jgi:hypothetical protein
VRQGLGYTTAGIKAGNNERFALDGQLKAGQPQ